MQIFALFLVVGSLALVSAKLKVGVYYETLCGDSKRFIRSQLYPLMKEGGSEYLDVEFIPYGKATTTVSGSTKSSYEFSCQHGKDECKGNEMHACALQYLSKDTALEFIHCSMTSPYPPRSLQDCSEQVGVSESTFVKIKGCVDTPEGKQLLANHGEATNLLDPKMSFVPTITFNGVYDEDKMWASQGNFKRVVCAQFKTKPDFCLTDGRSRAGTAKNRGVRSLEFY